MSDSPETLDHGFDRALSAARDTTATTGASFDDRNHVGHALTHHERPRLDGGPCDICERERARSALVAPVEVFAAQMRREIVANAIKGTRADWCSRSAESHAREVRQHTAKLVGALMRGDVRAIREYAADVGVCAMMAADAAGALDATQPGRGPDYGDDEYAARRPL